MTLKMKLISTIAMFCLVVGILIIGVLAASQQTLTMQGSVNFVVADKSLYVKDVRIKQNMDASEPTSISSFMPGYINGNFDLDLTGIVNTNKYGSFALYFDIINTTDIPWAISSYTLLKELQDEGVLIEYIGVIPTNSLTDTDGDGFKNFDSSTPIDGTLVVTIIAPNSTTIDLSGITIIINEYVAPALQVTNVAINDSTPDTTSEFNGVKGLSSRLDLSNITFETGETEIVISMTSLNANYVKNNVSWVDTSGVTISSTSLYLPQNPSEELASGERKDLKIYVNNNTGSATTISGLEVAFEEKSDLLQVSEEVSEYTGEKYWYVEMGTYSTTTDNAAGKRESEYLRWRYFSDTTDHYDFTETRPTGEGYFILENYYSSYASTSVGGLYVSWNNDYKNSSPYKHQLNGWTNIDANDYSTSTIRQYINGNTVQKSAANQSGTYVPSGASTNMFEYFNIDPDNDIIYTGIKGRTLGDLYTDMSNSTTNPQDVKMPKGSSSGWEGAEITYSKDDTDKFWLLSYYEAYTLLSGNATTSSDTDRKWGDDYCLRSPNSSVSNRAYSVFTSGRLSSGTVHVNDSTYAVRAAFKFSI